MKHNKRYALCGSVEWLKIRNEMQKNSSDKKQLKEFSKKENKFLRLRGKKSRI